MTGALRGQARKRTAVCAFVVGLFLLPASAFAWTKYQYFSGYSVAGQNTGVQTSGSTYRQYNNAYHSTQDYWRVVYFAVNGIDGQSYSYGSPTTLGVSPTTEVSGCEVIYPNSSGQAYSCATTVP